MSTHSEPYGAYRAKSTTGGAEERTGRAPERRSEPAGRPARQERISLLGPKAGPGSHMPLDTQPHWRWDNPLNILPAAILLLTLVALAGALLT